MEVILLEKVQPLGRLGDIVSVKTGYARNYLIPKGIAMVATPQNVTEFEARRAEFEHQETIALTAVEQQAAALAQIEITIQRRTGEEGRLFGSVGPLDIAQALQQAGHEIARQQVRIQGEGIRQVGEYMVTIHIHAGIESAIKLKVEPELIDA